MSVNLNNLHKSLDIYPLTICMDRYSGVYSGGGFTAWNCDPDEVPIDIYNDDVACADFWSKAEELYKEEEISAYGVGKTIQDAVNDLYKRLNPDVDEA